MNFYSELDNLSLSKLMARFHAAPPDGEEYAYTYYAEVASLIRQKGERGIEFLWNEVEKVNTARLRGILLSLTQPSIEIPNMTERLLTFFQDERPLVVAEAIDSLTRQGTHSILEEVLLLAQHASPYVKGSVLRFMSTFYPEQAIPLLIDGLNDPHFIVRENAADELGELEAVESLPFLEAKLADPHPHVRQAVETAIEFLVPLIEEGSEDISYQNNGHHPFETITSGFYSVAASLERAAA